ncbi:MAG: hypothetical protein M1396_03960 [Chloroflexi bacterium]|nr:hypothetical protein [Chloroflexota bacterium]
MSQNPPGLSAEGLERWKSEITERIGSYSQRARAVLRLAEEEARRLNHAYVDTEHLLLALLKERGGEAAKMLETLGIDREAVRKAIESAIGRGDRPSPSRVRWTPRAQAVLELATKLAQKLDQQHVDTEHVLLGLLQEGKGTAVAILEPFGLTVQRVRQEMARLLQERNARIVERLSQVLPPRGNVVSCRIDVNDLDAIDMLVEAGIRTTRSEAAAWLIHAGVEAQRDLLTKVRATVAQIRQLRQGVQHYAQGQATEPPSPVALNPDATTENTTES